MWKKQRILTSERNFKDSLEMSEALLATMLLEEKLTCGLTETGVKNLTTREVIELD